MTIELVRKSLSLTLEQVAKEVPCSEAYLKEIETNNIEPSRALLDFYAKRLNVDFRSMLVIYSRYNGRFGVVEKFRLGFVRLIEYQLRLGNYLSQFDEEKR